MRAAEAARNTIELIEDSVCKITDGSKLIKRDNSAFSQVANSTSKAGELIEEIAAASAEQSDGIK